VKLITALVRLGLV